MEIVNLNLIPGEAYPVCHASQFDEGRTIRCNLFNGSSVYTLQSGDSISVEVRKSDRCLTVEQLVNTQASYVDILTTKQMTAIAGDNICEIKIENGTKSIGSLNFIMQIEESPLNNGITNKESYASFKEMVEDIVEEILGGN